MVQSINHATEHREQIKSMLSALGVTPPDIGEITPRAFGKDRRRHIGNRFQE
jgi:uncharacterized damage-inducible protein DinB